MFSLHVGTALLHSIGRVPLDREHLPDQDLDREKTDWMTIHRSLATENALVSDGTGSLHDLPQHHEEAHVQKPTGTMQSASELKPLVAERSAFSTEDTAEMMMPMQALPFTLGEQFAKQSPNHIPLGVWRSSSRGNHIGHRGGHLDRAQSQGPFGAGLHFRNPTPPRG